MRPTKSKTALTLCALTGALLFTTPLAHASDFRTIDGTDNNPSNPNLGATDTPMIRTTTPAYDDGLSTPRGGDPSSLPSARAISNAVADQTDPTPNVTTATDWLWQWGQFVDHDIVLTGAASPAQPFNIPVPTGDPQFDPTSTGTQVIGLNRTDFIIDSDGVRQQPNLISTYIDASNVYGSDATRANDLRALDGIGSLRTSTATDGEVLLPFNINGLPNAPGPFTSFFIAGDVRANEQAGLTATHTVFLREHNRLVQQLDDRLTAADPDLAAAFTASGLTKGDYLYQAARAIVGAQMQKITYEQFLPVLLGPDALATFDGYDSTVDPSISNEFATGAYRLGHSMLSPTLQRVTDDGPDSALALRDAFFNPTEIIDNGVDSLLLGLASQQAEELNVEMVDDVRNFMFGAPGAGGFDLASLNIQRGRDHGLGSLNDIRTDMSLTPFGSFIDMTGGDAILADTFALVYDSVDDVDFWAGGLAEAHINDGMVGETFFMVIADQFARLRDGDSFFYLGGSVMDDLLLFAPDFMDTTSLSSIIRRNTTIESIQDNAFMMFIPTPEPLTATLSLLALTALAASPRRNRKQ